MQIPHVTLTYICHTQSVNVVGQKLIAHAAKTDLNSSADTVDFHRYASKDPSQGHLAVFGFTDLLCA